MGDAHANRVQCESSARSVPVLSRRVPLAGADLRNLRVSARYHHHIKEYPEDHLKLAPRHLRRRGEDGFPNCQNSGVVALGGLPLPN